MGEKNPSGCLYKDRKHGIAYLAGVEHDSSFRLFPTDYHTTGVGGNTEEKLSPLLKSLKTNNDCCGMYFA